MNINNIIITQRQLMTNNQLSRKSKKSIVFPKNINPLISIIIPNFNNYIHLKSCLYYLFKNTQNINYEVILVFDNISDESQAFLKEVENINKVRCQKGSGILNCINKAVQSAKGDYVCILHDYTIPKVGWLKSLLQTIQNKGVGIVGAKNLHKDGLMVESSFFLDNKGFIQENSQLKKLNLEKQKTIDYFPCSAILIKKEAFRLIGGLDEYFSDDFYSYADLCYAFKYKLKLKTVYQPEAEVIHLQKINFSYDISFRIPFYLKWKKNIQEEKNKNKSRENADIKVCFTLTDNYYIFAACAMASILINSNYNDRYHFYILTDYLSDKNKAFFKKLKLIRDFDLSFLIIDNNELKEYEVSYWGTYVYYRFKIFDLIKADRVLYLDSDIIVRDDLGELFKTDLTGYLAAAALDQNNLDSKKRIKLKDEAKYINAGVVLFDLNECNKLKIAEKLFDLANNYPTEFIYADQDILNFVMQTKIKILSKKWNYMTSDNKNDNCFIRHYAQKKPWNDEYKNKDKEEYFEYLRFILNIGN